MKYNIALEMGVDFSAIARSGLEKELIRYNKNRLMVSVVLDDSATIHLLETLRGYQQQPSRGLYPQSLLLPTNDSIKEVVMCVDCTSDVSYKVH